MGQGRASLKNSTVGPVACTLGEAFDVGEWLSDWADRLMKLDPQAVLVTIALMCAIAVLVYGIGSLISWLWQAALRGRVRAEFGLARIPASVRIRRAHPIDDGHLELAFPTWRYAKRDGTADRRRSRNTLIDAPSTLLLGPYRMRSLDPFAIYDVAGQARAAGHYVPWTPQELHKGSALERTQRAREDTADAAAIAASFADRPTDFEEYCADLLRSFGYRAHVTPKVRDGGYDLELEYEGVRYIAECKCYAPPASIGRPYLQKLVGANVTARAQGLMFLTTASYSRDAQEFARASGIELVDGAKLSALARQAFGEAHLRHKIDGAALTTDELWHFYPADIRPAIQG